MTWDPPQHPILTRPEKDDPIETRRAKFKAFHEAIAEFQNELAAWEAQLPANQGLMFDAGHMIHVITRNIGGGWRTTSFDKSYRCPWGHHVHNTRLGALKEETHNTRIADLPFIPERDPVKTATKTEATPNR